MTTIQWLPLLSRLGSALVLPAGSAGSRPGQPGGATQRGLWRSRVTGPASRTRAAAVPQTTVRRAIVRRATGRQLTVRRATGRQVTVPPATAISRTAGHRAAGASVTRVRGRGS